MKVITKLTGKVTQADWTEKRGTVQSVHDEPQPGFFRSVSLGAAGVTVKRGGTIVGIPLSEILRLAESSEPAMVPPPTAKKKPAKSE